MENVLNFIYFGIIATTAIFIITRWEPFFGDQDAYEPNIIDVIILIWWILSAVVVFVGMPVIHHPVGMTTYMCRGLIFGLGFILVLRASSINLYDYLFTKKEKAIMEKAKETLL